MPLQALHVHPDGLELVVPGVMMVEQRPPLGVCQELGQGQGTAESLNAKGAYDPSPSASERQPTPEQPTCRSGPLRQPGGPIAAELANDAMVKLRW